MKIRFLRRLMTLLCLCALPILVNASEQSEIAYLDFDNDVFFSVPTSSQNTTHIYDLNDRISVDVNGDGLGRITDINGNNVLEMAAPSAESIANSSAKLYFAGLPDNEKYRIGWNFCRKSGTRMDITLENGLWNQGDSSKVRVGFIRFKADNTIVISSNWKGDSQEGTESCTPDVWHSLEGEFDPVNKKAVWYLDGKKIGEYTYQADGNISVAIFQAVASNETEVSNKETVFQIDDIESQSGSISSGIFNANAFFDNNKIILRFTEPINSRPTLDKIKLVSDEASYTSIKVEKFGKKYEFSFDNDVLNSGKNYTIIIDGTIRSAYNYFKKLDNTSIDLDVAPDEFEITIIPHTVGGIYTDNDELKFEVIVKNLKNYDTLAECVLEITDINDNLLINDKLEQIQLSANEIRKFVVAPQLKSYGCFNLNIKLKPNDCDTSVKSTLPFSRMFSNGVQNPRMGVSTHYMDQYRTEIENLSSEIGLNMKAGFGVIRDDIQWNVYESTQGIYKLSDKQKMMFEQLEVNNLIPYPVLGNGTWSYGEYWPYPSNENQLEKYGAYVQQLAKDTNRYVPVFETGNEWNSNYIGHAPMNYVNMMRVAYENIKAVNENLKVVGFSVGVSDESINFLEECLQLGAMNYCDAISIHPYSVLESPEEFDIQSKISEVLNLLKKYNAGDKEIIISEWGWSSTVRTDCTEELQAKYTIRGAGLAGGGVDAIVWYEGQEHYNEAVIEENFGLLRRTSENASLSAKPVFVALSCFNSLTGDKEQRIAEKDQNGTYLCRYENANQLVIQFWNPIVENTILIDSLSEYCDATLYDMYGNQSDIFEDNGKYYLTATDSPAYLVLTRRYPNPELPNNELPEADNALIVCNYDFDNSTNFDLYPGGGERLDLNDDIHNGVIKFYAQEDIGEAGIKQVGAIAANTPESTKKFLISYDFKVLQTDVSYVFRAYRTDNKPFMFFKVGSNGRVGFLNNGGWTDGNPEYGSVDWVSTTYNVGEWNNVDIFFTPEENSFKYFVNGVCIGKSRPSNFLAFDKPFGWINIYAGAGSESNTNGLYWDNFKIQYVDDTPFYSVALRDGNTIKIEFSETPDITSGNVIKLNGAKSGNIPANVLFNERGLIIKAPFMADGQCTLFFSDDIKSITGKQISGKFINLFNGGVPDSYIDITELHDVLEKEYIPFSQIPITQNYIKFKTVGEFLEINRIGISLVDNEGSHCKLGALSKVSDGIKVKILENLKPNTAYTLSITDNITLMPIYKAEFETSNDMAMDGFYEFDIVSKSGNPIQSLVVGEEVFVFGKNINTSNTGKNVVAVIASYSELPDGMLRLIDVASVNADLNLDRLTKFGPDNIGVSITVSDDTNVLKSFIWETEKYTPLVDAVVKR